MAEEYELVILEHKRVFRDQEAELEELRGALQQAMAEREDARHHSSQACRYRRERDEAVRAAAEAEGLRADMRLTLDTHLKVGAQPSSGV